MSNRAIRVKILECGLKHWQVARQIGIDPATFSRWMREEMSEEQKAKVDAAIQRLTMKGGAVNA